MILELKGVTRAYTHHGRKHTVLNQLSLEVQRGEFLCILGPSGCGKTTLLRLIAGLEPLTGGEIIFNEDPVPGPCNCRGMIFQEDALYPWKTVWENVAFGLELAGAPKENRDDRVRHYIKLVGLQGFEQHRPHQLSGGMRQRVQIARTLALSPQILLMDEPFAALDEITRQRMDNELLDIWGETRQTILFVTHSVDEALLLGDRIVTLNQGNIQDSHTVPLPRPRLVESYTFWEESRRLKHRFAEICAPQAMVVQHV